MADTERNRSQGNNENIMDEYSLKPNKILGQGASCEVVRATRKADKVLCALKIMNKNKEIHRTMYNQETDILKKLAQNQHPNIIHYVDSAITRKGFLIFTKLSMGGELFDRIVDDKWEMTEKIVASLVQQMLSALSHLHMRNIVHRDLKPENFLFETRAADAKLILIDFGTAKVVDDDTKYTDLVGTPFYLAPESATNQPFRTGAMLKSSDIWSIGVIAYICLTGTPPFYGNSNREICKAIVKQKVSYPPNSTPSASFKDFIMRSLQKRWKKRISMVDARQHPWVIGQTAQDNNISIDTIRSLRQFTAQTKLKKAVSRILAQNMGAKPQERVKEHFKRLDSDNNGRLDVEELEQVFIHLNYHKTEAKLEAQKVMAEVDVDNNGEINFEEFATVWQRKLLTVNDQYIHAVFSVLDVNHDGKIDAQELADVMDWMTPEEIEQMIAEADSDQADGEISFKEFKNAMKETVQPGQFGGNQTLHHDDLETEHHEELRDDEE